MATLTTGGAGSKFGGFPLYDPRPERASRRRFFRDEIPKLDLANSLYCPSGRWPARGWILMRRGDYNNLSAYSTALTLQLDDLNTFTPVVRLQNMAIVQARCVSRGVASDANALYLVEITDLRGVIWNQWFQLGTTSSYNVRAPAYPEQYYTQTLHAGSGPFTWDYMVQDLWNQMPLLGTYPGLPITPLGTPENFIFPGVSCWEMLNNILDYIGCVIDVDLTQSSPYSIVSAGAADANFTALTTKYTTLLEDDYEWLSTGSGRVPGKVVVLFHRRNQYYGTEETVRDDSFQWSTNSIYSVTVNAPATFTGAAGTHYIWAEFTVRYDTNGNPLAADVTTANSIAQERVTQYFNRIYRSTAGSLKQVYTGVIPFPTGSLIDGVAWRMNSRPEAVGAGWTTEIIRGPQPPWPEVEVDIPRA